MVRLTFDIHMQLPSPPELRTSSFSLSTYRRGFTQLDLVFTVMVLLLLAGLLVPALAGARSKVKNTVCQENLRRLMLAWHLYADANQDQIVKVYHGGTDTTKTRWASGWLDWSPSRDNTNTLLLTTDRYATLAKYLDHSPVPFKCPNDDYLSAPQKRLHWGQRARSVSASICIGDGNAESGPWQGIYKHVRKTSDFAFPSPRETFVYLDEHPDSINDSAYFSPSPTGWVDVPALYHDGASSFAFADGHAELHRWEGSLAAPSMATVTYRLANNWPARPSDLDIHWLSYHTARVSETSY